MRTICSMNPNWIFTKNVPANLAQLPTNGEKVNLPHCWNATDGQDGGNDYHRGTCYYSKRFLKTQLPEGAKYYLEVDGANSSADVYLNGTHLGHHDGGYSTWRVDITETLERENLFAIVVNNEANEIVYPQIAVSGLGDYSRNSGYTDGSVNLEWKTATFNYDRGTKISVDVMDDEESRDIAFTMAGAELMRTKVAPEADAFTFATLAGIAGISTATPATYADATEFLQALIEAKNKMDEDEVPEEGRILYATPTLMNGVMALDTTKSREILASFAVTKKVPQASFSFKMSSIFKVLSLGPSSKVK